ncbi:hypothetical protein OQA88_1822 [Cercophora sp. LCS_1]
MTKLTPLLLSALLPVIHAHSHDGTQQKPLSWDGPCLPGPILHASHPSCVIIDEFPPDTPADYNPSLYKPWTHRPLCPSETPYCVYTSSKFATHGISIITLPFSNATKINDTTAIRAIEVVMASDLSKKKLAAEPDPKPYEIRDIPGKGKGMIATRKIERGTVLMVEHAAIIADMVFPVRVRRLLGREMLKRGMKRLGAKGEGQLLELARTSSNRDEVPAAEDVMKTNSFTVKISGKSYMGLFPRVARINHACKPSAITRFDEETLSMTVRTFRDIEAGEEITLSYSDFGLTFHERQRILRAKWGFECTCDICSAPPAEIAESDARRDQINELGVAVLKHVENQDLKSAIKSHKDMMNAIEEEALAPHMGDYYEVMARLLAGTKNIKEAKKYVRLAIEEFKVAGEEKKELEAFLKVKE